METMTSLERVVAAVQLKQPDRVPVIPVLMTRALKEIGARADEAHRDPELMARAKIAAWEKYGGDAVVCGTDLFVEVEALGVELDYLPYAQPSLVEHLIKEKDDIERVPPLDPSKGRIPNVAKEISLVKERFDNQLVVAVVIAGPLTAAELLRGSTEFLLDMEEDPKYVHRLLRLTTDAIKRYASVLAEAGAHAINMLDPFSSSDVISPEQYHEFGFPYHKEVMEHIKGTGAVPLIHICTYTQPIWEDMANTGAFGLHGDFEPDMALAKETVGKRIALFGNVCPYKSLINGTPEDVIAESEHLIKTVGRNGGFILAPGCDLDYNVPDANIMAMVETAKRSTYPLEVG